jgi:hypothetical protein
MGNENVGTTSQALVGGALVDAAMQEQFGLLSLGGSCSASLLRNDWVISAAHCVEIKDASGNRIPDPARPGQFEHVPPGTVIVNANWGGGQAQAAVQIETFRPLTLRSSGSRPHSPSAGPLKVFPG